MSLWRMETSIDDIHSFRNLPFWIYRSKMSCLNDSSCQQEVLIGAPYFVLKISRTGSCLRPQVIKEGVCVWKSGGYFDDKWIGQSEQLSFCRAGLVVNSVLCIDGDGLVMNAVCQ
uniref:Uncharacterized protein n=1 Tax=Arion vulgaris TaxID=1028688 RepID=A0A0B7B1H2_9EUPU